MKKSLVVVVALLTISGFCFAGSIILPFWQDDGTPIYSMLVVLNTSPDTSNTVNVMYYGKTGNMQQGANIEKTINARNLEIFGSGHYGGELSVATTDAYGYAMVWGSEGMLLAVGLVYDNSAHAGYPISCFPGSDEGGASEGW